MATFAEMQRRFYKQQGLGDEQIARIESRPLDVQRKIFASMQSGLPNAPSTFNPVAAAPTAEGKGRIIGEAIGGAARQAGENLATSVDAVIAPAAGFATGVSRGLFGDPKPAAATTPPPSTEPPPRGNPSPPPIAAPNRLDPRFEGQVGDFSVSQEGGVQVIRGPKVMNSGVGPGPGFGRNTFVPKPGYDEPVMDRRGRVKGYTVSPGAAAVYEAQLSAKAGRGGTRTMPQYGGTTTDPLDLARFQLDTMKFGADRVQAQRELLANADFDAIAPVGLENFFKNSAASLVEQGVPAPEAIRMLQAAAAEQFEGLSEKDVRRLIKDQRSALMDKLLEKVNQMAAPY